VRGAALSYGEALRPAQRVGNIVTWAITNERWRNGVKLGSTAYRWTKGSGAQTKCNGNGFLL
jgi:hypothetical protein